MSDIVERLRHWSHGLTYDPAAGLMHEAAAEIARLRLTDEEREAVAGAIDVLEQEDQWHAVGEARIKTLRGLLERLQ